MQIKFVRKKNFSLIFTIHKRTRSTKGVTVILLQKYSFRLSQQIRYLDNAYLIMYLNVHCIMAVKQTKKHKTTRKYTVHVHAYTCIINIVPDFRVLSVNRVQLVQRILIITLCVCALLNYDLQTTNKLLNRRFCFYPRAVDRTTQFLKHILRQE